MTTEYNGAPRYALRETQRLTTREIEDQIVARALTDLVTAGYTLAVYDYTYCEVVETTDVLQAMKYLRTVSDEYVYVQKNSRRAGWIWLVWGNGHDVLADNTSRIEPHLQGAIELSNEFAEQR